MSHYLIIANGQFLPKEMLLAAIKNKTVVALDGAAEKLRQLNITPNIILGDFDSLSKDELAFWKNNEKVLVIEAPDQNFTDLEKAILYCDEQRAQSITIVCATAGRVDHHEYTMHLLEKYYQKNRLMLLHTEEQTIRYAQNEEVLIYGRAGDKCGFNAKRIGQVTSQGLLYECSNVEMSYCNSLMGESARLTVKGGALLIMPLCLYQIV